MASVNLSSTIRISRMSSSSSFSLSSQLRCHTSLKPRILVSLEARTSVPVSFRLPSSSNRILAYRSPFSVVDSGSPVVHSTQQNNGVFIVGEFMTKRERLHVVKPTTTIDEALEALVENRITGLPVIDDNWDLVGVVSDYDILALDSISGSGRNEGSLFPEVGRTWKTFNEIQKLLGKTNGKVVSEVMTPAPLVVRETTNLEDVARLLLETKYRRFPVVDSSGKLVGIITRGNVIRAALHIKRQMGR